MISTQKKFIFNYDDLGRNPELNDEKKIKSLEDEKMVEKLLNKNSSNELNIDLKKINNDNNKEK